ncbi:hypothetical protein FSP39_005155 [Pinctada imbricata]|uniref:K Homology domain-containing protein n=1 Tax=Pinctada imbricata TaxID=66713 RepID=A0AA88Y857_PINIB|nr:hypothetical protein FSP39_005155 [Pinctada imbricata]
MTTVVRRPTGRNACCEVLRDDQSMDVLRPQIIRIGNRCYRKNPSLNRNVEEEEEEYEISHDTEDRGWNDEICDLNTQVVETENGYEIRLDLPSAFFKHIIGRKGETKRRLETETKTQIRIPKAGVEGEIVIVGHDRKGVVSAKTRIDLLVDSARQKEPFTHFLSIPFNQNDMKDKFEEFKSDVLRLCDGDRGIDGTIFQKPEKLHLTIGTLVLLNQNEIQKAIDVLQECKEDLIIPILKRERLVPRLQGLEYMNDDPGAVDVLYAKIQDGDVAERLQILADRLVDRFSSTGLMMQEFSHVKLHITVMNSLMRKDPTALPEAKDQRQRNNRDRRERESFDATFLMKKLGQYDFGDHEVTQIHLSQRHGLGSNGYYGCAGSVSVT